MPQVISLRSAQQQAEAGRGCSVRHATLLGVLVEFGLPPRSTPAGVFQPAWRLRATIWLPRCEAFVDLLAHGPGNGESIDQWLATREEVPAPPPGGAAPDGMLSARAWL